MSIQCISQLIPLIGGPRYYWITYLEKKHQSWIIKDSYVPMKELSYDKKGNLLKEKYYKFSNIGNHKITKSIEVKNIQKNHTTQLRFNNIRINTGLNDDQFHERHLKRIPQFEK